jgi:hypothetical protein
LRRDQVCALLLGQDLGLGLLAGTAVVFGKAWI